MRVGTGAVLAAGWLSAVPLACSKADARARAPLPCTAETVEHRSGDRLRARVAVTDEGDCTFLGWYDQVQRQSCSFQVARDGSWHCLPDATLKASVGYQKEGCTDELFYYPEQSCQNSAEAVLQTTWHGERESSGFRRLCSTTTRVFKKGPLSASTPTYSAEIGECTGLSAEGIDWYEPGEEIPPDSFARGELGAAHTEGRLTRTTLSTQDGTLEYREYVDVARSKCKFMRAEDGVTRCLPPNPSYSGGYADPACREPLVMLDECAPEWSTTALVMLSDECGPRYAVYERGESIVQSYYQAADGCRADTSPSSLVQLYASAGVVPADTFVEAARSVADDDPGRLKPIFWHVEGLSALAGWYDSELKTECAFELADDQKLRCLPAPQGSGGLYAFTDDTCSESAMFVIADSCSDLPTFYREKDGSSCPPTTTVSALGEPLTFEQLPPLWQKSFDGCIPKEPFMQTPLGALAGGPTGKAEGLLYLRVGEALDPNLFVSAEERIE